MSEAATLRYHKLFNPKPVEHPPEPSVAAGDQRWAVTYVYSEEIILRVNVALATQRPLLVRGPSGTGKSSLARSVAQVLGWRYYETVITSRTQARELLWHVDLLSRLHDAQAQSRRRFETGYERYVMPGPLWWAFDEASARAQKIRGSRGSLGSGGDPNLGTPHARAVVLLDEIDKADPDTPNNLLVPLGSLQFQVEETGRLVVTSPDLAPLIIITTNDERELPLAFLRRCIELRIEYPTRERLVEIGHAQLPTVDKGLLNAVAQALSPGTEQPSTSAAEYVDALRACVNLKLEPDGNAFKQLLSATIWKHGRKEPGK